MTKTYLGGGGFVGNGIVLSGGKGIVESGGSGIVWSGGRGMSSSGSAGRCRGGGGLSGRGIGLSMGIMSTTSPLVTSGDELLLLRSSSPLPLQEKNQHLHGK